MHKTYITHGKHTNQNIYGATEILIISQTVGYIIQETHQKMR